MYTVNYGNKRRYFNTLLEAITFATKNAVIWGEYMVVLLKCGQVCAIACRHPQGFVLHKLLPSSALNDTERQAFIEFGEHQHST